MCSSDLIIHRNRAPDASGRLSGYFSYLRTKYGDFYGKSAVYIHGFAADEMLYFPFNLRRTSGFIGAIVGLSLIHI